MTKIDTKLGNNDSHNWNINKTIPSLFFQSRRISTLYLNNLAMSKSYSSNLSIFLANKKKRFFSIINVCDIALRSSCSSWLLLCFSKTWLSDHDWLFVSESLILIEVTYKHAQHDALEFHDSLFLPSRSTLENKALTLLRYLFN